MHRIASVFATLLAALITFPAPCRAATPVPQVRPSPPAFTGRLAMMAPADAYFGPFGMSPLSIRSTIGLLGRQYHQRTISDRDLLRKALITENALRLWRTRYPADPWMAPTFYHLEQLYQAVQTDEAHKHATAILNEVVRAYPNSKEGRASRARLAAGFPPLVPESPLVAPTSGPEQTTSSEASGSSAAPEASPSAVASPAPGSTAAPAAGPPPAGTKPPGRSGVR